MKLILLISGLLLCCFSLLAQDAQQILQKSFDQCQSVRNGYYEMTRYWKSMTKKDTSVSSFTCYFKKLDHDTIFSSAFHSQYFYKGEYTGDALYTGDDFVTTSKKDSTARIMSKAKWAEEINNIAHNYKFYTPFTSTKSSPMLHDSAFLDTTNSFRILGEEMINGTSCYRIQVNEKAKNDSADIMQVLRIEYHFWINKADFLPYQYSTSIDIAMNNDTMNQYELERLNKFDINHLENDSILTLSSIPNYYQLKDYVPWKSPDLLPLDTIAPHWELNSLQEEKVKLKDLKGQLVLIDFFYKSCYPCMQALPALQSLSEKYKGKGLRVIGIDPFDTKEDDMGTFLSKRGITYTVLMDGKDVASSYHVSGYPTMYLIDKTGKIIFVQEGYGKDVDQTLDEIIAKHL
ncbi:MAG TPA: TlpA disulfide reductase family protein [Saprospiraceae bacterium]|nr:TlpA disulfide reductase family protein [Saprospiraceae bacterium]